MKHYRIVQRGKDFFVDRKFLFFWIRATEQHYLPRMGSISVPLIFSSKEKAREFVHTKRTVNAKKKVKSIVVEYISIEKKR
jgi:hypothetical protein